LGKTMKIVATATVLLLLGTGQATAEEWSCRNLKAEITCNAKGCTVALPPNFTAADLHLKSDGSIEYCAYSGCWKGKAAFMQRTKHILTMVGVDLAWSQTGGSSANVSVILDTRTLVAIVYADGFTHPMRCKKR